MSNEFFTHTNPFVPNTKVKSNEANVKFAGVEQGFDKLPTQQQLKGGSHTHVVDTGTANNYVVTLPYAPIGGYHEGLKLSFRPLNSNTGSSVINVNGLGNKSILLPGGGAVLSGDIPAGSVVSLVYDNGAFRFQGTSLSAVATATTKAGEASASATAAAASQADVTTRQADVTTKHNNVVSLESSTQAAKTAAEASAAAAATSATNAAASEAVVSAAFISVNTTLNVPSTYATIQAALDFLKPKRIAADATVTIQVADGTYNFTSSIILNHIDGERIHLKGNLTTPANCILRFNGSNPNLHLIQIFDGKTFGSVSGFTLTLTAQAADGNIFNAIKVSINSRLMDITDCVISNWARPILISDGSDATINSVTISAARNFGINVKGKSSVIIYDATISNIANASGNLGSGVHIEQGSRAYIDFTTATTCRIAGLHVATGSQVHVGSNATFNSNTNEGVIVDSASLLSMGQACTANSNGNHGYLCKNGAVLYLNGCIGDSNTGSGVFALDGGVVVAPACFFRTNTRYGIELSNAAQPYLVGTTITGNVIAQQSGAAYIYNSVSGPAEINTSENKDLFLRPNGTGKVKFGTHSAIGAETVTGFIEIKDAGGTIRKIAVVS